MGFVAAIRGRFRWARRAAGAFILAIAALPAVVRLALLWPVALLCVHYFVEISRTSPIADSYQLFYPAIFASVLLFDARFAALVTLVFLGIIHIVAYHRGLGPPGSAHVLTALDFLADAVAFGALAAAPRLMVRARIASAALIQDKAKQYQQFVEQAPAAVAIFDRDMRYLAASARWVQTQQIKPGYLGRSHYVDYPEFPDHWREVHRRAMDGESARSERELYVAADGQKRWVRWEVQPWRISENEIGGILIFAEDITATVNMQRALIDNERRVAAIVDHAMDAIVSVDHQGRVISANPAACEIFGYRRDEMVGLPTGRLVPHPNVERDLDGEGAKFASPSRREPVEIVGTRRIVSGLRRNGESFPLELTVSEAILADERLRIGIMRDLSPIQAERRRVATLRDELAHISRLNDMGAMVAGLAHEVGQPVAAILNFAAAYRRALAATGAPPEGDLVGKIETQARRAGDILARLRGFIEKKPPARRSVPICALLDDALQLASLRSGATVTRNPGVQRELAIVDADPIQIEQILVNLLRNADDALRDRPAPEIIISTSAPRPGVLRISVRDNGPGVAPDAQGRLFEPFFTTKPYGMGVGLSISRDIAEAHEGGLRYRGNAPHGAIFDLDLPRAAPDSPADSAEKAEIPAKND